MNFFIVKTQRVDGTFETNLICKVFTDNYKIHLVEPKIFRVVENLIKAGTVFFKSFIFEYTNLACSKHEIVN